MEQIGTCEHYLEALSSCLSQKEQVMARLTELTDEQAKVLAQDTLDMDAFDSLMGKKQEQLELLEKLDTGFEQVYTHVREELTDHPMQYREVIERLQGSIHRLTEMGMALEVQEHRNKERMEILFSASKEKIRSFHVNNQAVANYYKNMANKHQEGKSYFLDQKK